MLQLTQLDKSANKSYVFAFLDGLGTVGRYFRNEFLVLLK